MKSLTIKQLPLDNRPYEKLERYTEKSLSDSELIAIIIKSGSKSETSIQLAQRLLSLDNLERGLNFLYDLSLQEMMQINGIGRIKAIQIKAMLELSRRLNNERVNEYKVIKSPTDIYNLVASEMVYLKQEMLKIVILDTKNKVLKIETISVGSLNRNVVEAREVFSEPIRLLASNVILIHNHPSGDPSPSKEDIKFTKKYMEIGRVLGIGVIDHIVIGNNNYISIKEKGYI